MPLLFFPVSLISLLILQRKYKIVVKKIFFLWEPVCATRRMWNVMLDTTDVIRLSSLTKKNIMMGTRVSNHFYLILHFFEESKRKKERNCEAGEQKKCLSFMWNNELWTNSQKLGNHLESLIAPFRKEKYVKICLLTAQLYNHRLSLTYTW